MLRGRLVAIGVVVPIVTICDPCAAAINDRVDRIFANAGYF